MARHADGCKEKLEPLIVLEAHGRLGTSRLRKRQRICELTSNTVNGQPGLVFTQAGKTIQELTFAAEEEGRVSRVYSVLNPDKLRRGTPVVPTDRDATNASTT